MLIEQEEMPLFRRKRGHIFQKMRAFLDFRVRPANIRPKKGLSRNELITGVDRGFDKG